MQRSAVAGQRRPQGIGRSRQHHRTPGNGYAIDRIAAGLLLRVHQEAGAALYAPGRFL
jgi:hypothetical protein